LHSILNLSIKNYSKHCLEIINNNYNKINLINNNTMDIIIVNSKNKYYYLYLGNNNDLLSTWLPT